MYYYKHAESTIPDFDTMIAKKERVDRLDDQIKFIKLLDVAIDKMLQLIDSPVQTDLYEASEFFVAAYQFGLDNANKGIYRLLRVLQKNEPERREVVVKALKPVYLATDEKNLE